MDLGSYCRRYILVYRVWWVNWEKLVDLGWGFRYDGGMSGGDAKKEEFINPRDAFYGLNSKYDGEPVKPREVERVKEKSSKFWRDYPELKADFDGVERRREFRHDEWVDDSAIQKEEAYVGDKQIVNEPHATINEEINEKVRRANPRYQKARLHYLGHRFNLIHPDETGLLVAEDNDDFNVGRLRLVEDLLRVTNGEGDLREVKDRLIAVGVYVKDLENLSETIKPMFQKREELLQKFYDEGSKEDLESLEKEIGEIFGVEIIYERIKNGERAQPKKEVEKKVSEETKKVDSTSRVVDTEKNKNEVYENLYLRGYQPKGSDWVKAGEELERLGVDIQKIIKEQNIELKNKLIKAVWIINDKKLSREKIDEAKKLIDDYLGLNENPLLQELDIKAEEPEKAEVIGEEKEKYLEYLGVGLIDDLKNIYPQYGLKTDPSLYSKAVKRLESGNKLKRIWTKNTKKGFEGKPVRNFKAGQLTIQILEDYFVTDSGYPKSWDDNLVKEMVVGDYEEFKRDLEVARKRKLERIKGNVQEKGKKKGEKGEERPVRLEEDVLFERFRLLAEKYKTLETWENWVDRLIRMSGEERKSAVDQLQATMYLLEHPLERIKHADYWRETGMGILRDLRAVAEV